MNHPLVIGVSGGSGSGKTTLVASLEDALGHNDVAVLEHGWYYRDRADVGAVDRAAFNYDHPDSLDTGLLIQHLRALREGQTVHAPIYNCTLGARKAETTPVRPASIIIVEGILVFADDMLRSLMDVKVFVDTDADTRFIRRLARDMAERGRSVGQVINQYVTTVKPMHLAFVEPGKRFADLVVSEGGHNHVAVTTLLALIRSAADRPST